MADKILFENEWVKVIDRDGYTMVHGTGGAVAVLPFRGSRDMNNREAIEFLARIEPVPPHGPKPHLCGLTGGIDGNEMPVDAAMRETFEESGYHVTKDQMIHLGTIWPSKLSDTVVHLFAVDVSNADWTTPPGDGSIYEQQSSTTWLPYQKAAMVPTGCFAAMLLRLSVFFRQGFLGG